MENSSKALIMAGEILIAILVLSLIAYLTVMFGQFSAGMHEKISESQRTEFNSHFFNCEGRSDITVQDIVSIIHFAKQENDSRELKYNDSSIYYVSVKIDGVDSFNKYSTAQEYNDNNIEASINKFIKDNNTKYFSCNIRLSKSGNNIVESVPDLADIVTNDNTGLVSSINFVTVNSNIKNIINNNK